MAPSGNTMQSALGSKAVAAALYKAIESITTPAWVDETCAHYPDSDQVLETYDDLTKPSGLTEVTGDARDIQGNKYQDVDCRNRRFGTEAVVRWLEQRFDKRSHLDRWIAGLQERAQETVPRLVAGLFTNGHTSTTYKGARSTYDRANFFGNGHRSAQDNTIQIAAAGAGNIPTSAEMETAITKARALMLSFTDDGGGLSNASANKFALLFPTSLEGAALGALKLQTVLEGGQARDNLLAVRTDLQITPYRVPFFDTAWGSGTPKCVLVRTDSVAKPLFRQTMIPLMVTPLAEGSDQAKRQWRHSYFIDTVIGEGYAFWEHAVRIEFT